MDAAQSPMTSSSALFSQELPKLDSKAGELAVGKGLSGNIDGHVPLPLESKETEETVLHSHHIRRDDKVLPTQGLISQKRSHDQVCELTRPEPCKRHRPLDSEALKVRLEALVSDVRNSETGDQKLSDEEGVDIQKASAVASCEESETDSGEGYVSESSSDDAFSEVEDEFYVDCVIKKLEEIYDKRHGYSKQILNEQRSLLLDYMRESIDFRRVAIKDIKENITLLKECYENDRGKFNKAEFNEPSFLFPRRSIYDGEAFSRQELTLSELFDLLQRKQRTLFSDIQIMWDKVKPALSCYDIPINPGFTLEMSRDARQLMVGLQVALKGCSRPVIFHLSKDDQTGDWNTLPGKLARELDVCIKLDEWKTRHSGYRIDMDLDLDFADLERPLLRLEFIGSDLSGEFRISRNCKVAELFDENRDKIDSDKLFQILDDLKSAFDAMRKTVYSHSTRQPTAK